MATHRAVRQPQRIIELTEYVPQLLPRDALPTALGEELWRRYGKQIVVEFPSPKTGGQWQLTAQGWAGYIPLSPDIQIWLRPKVQPANLFRMWEYAYDVPMDFSSGLIKVGTLPEVFESLAVVLARRVLDRARRGFFRAYLPHTARLPYVRGRLETVELMRTPWSINLQCHYHEPTTDIEENRILAWTLWKVARSGFCSVQTAALVRQAYRTLQGEVTLQPCKPAICLGRSYNRLNDDYRILHALCHFFLEGTGPSHERGDHGMLPFLVNMEQLFELFVAGWLRRHLPSSVNLRTQERVRLDAENHLAFRIDMVIRDADNGQPGMVLDTKYKNSGQPLTDDIAQVVAYARTQNCSEAVLVYPQALRRRLDVMVGDTRVRSATFALGRDLETAGQTFMRVLDLGPQ
jgi:5-methylcytosine-specific restriction enzyme subunit McrC